jgi:hypothetical protein
MDRGGSPHRPTLTASLDRAIRPRGRTGAAEDVDSTRGFAAARATLP